MMAIAGFVLLMVWLGLGGWACAQLDVEDPRAAVMCMVLGPFMAGYAIGCRPTQPHNGEQGS